MSRVGLGREGGRDVPFADQHQSVCTQANEFNSLPLMAPLVPFRPLSHSLVVQLGLAHVVEWLPGYSVLFFVEDHHLYTVGGGGAQCVGVGVGKA